MIGPAHLGAIAAATPRAVPPGGGHAYWRIYFPNTVSPNYISIAEIEMYSSVDGSDICSGGTASASSSNGPDVAANAFDNDNGTNWGSTAWTTPYWIRYDFASPVNVVQFKLVAASTNYPSPCKLQWSDDGSDWTDASDVMEVRAWRGSNAEQKFFAGGTKSYWRLYVSDNQSGGYTNIAELELRGSVGGADLTSPGGPAKIDSAYFGASSDLEVFDNDTGTFWESGGTTPHWVWYAFGKDVDIAQISIKTGPTAGESPKDFKLQFSGDGSTWTDALTVTGETGWTGGEVRLFNV